METKEILTQKEIKALLTSVEDNGPTPADTSWKDERDIKLFDFTNQNALINTGIPALNAADERFALGFSESITNDMCSSSSVEFSGTRVISFIDSSGYLQY